jgi:predicted GNAT family acetyltransferase
LSDVNNALNVVHDRERQQFYIDLGDGFRAELDYMVRGSEHAFTHTGVPGEFRGRGLADKLASAAFDTAKAEGWRVIPACSFIQTYVQRHKELQSLLAE